MKSSAAKHMSLLVLALALSLSCLGSSALAANETDPSSAALPPASGTMSEEEELAELSSVFMPIVKEGSNAFKAMKDEVGKKCTAEYPPSSFPATEDGLVEMVENYTRCFSDKLGFPIATGYRGPLAEEEAIFTTRKPASNWTGISEGQLVPSGSVMKSFLGVAAFNVLNSTEGAVTWDTPMYPFVNRVLSRDFNTSLDELFDDKRIKDVTIQQLLSMTSGLQDYGEDMAPEFIGYGPGNTQEASFTPIEYIDNMIQTWGNKLKCDPGTCHYYSSNGFAFAGMMLVDILGLDSWKDLDILELAFQSNPGLKSEFNNTVASTPNKLCSEYGQLPDGSNRVVSQWSENGTNLYDYDCFDGWAFGNLMIDAPDTASWFWHLYGLRDILGTEDVDLMLTPTNTSSTYGLASEINAMQGQGKLNNRYSWAGHQGTDWGSSNSGAGLFMPNAKDNGKERAFALSLTQNDLSIHGQDDFAQTTSLTRASTVYLANAIIQLLEKNFEDS
ncbi:hypothetical protein A3770_15p75200 [Chloropicon primus]|uniref:Beta-lactamase-related domain-containing protein n=1 Tax=Chloropicon primus TaxID=1764295 RepID=A0A5B8MZE1_9CHLO|nr:hypothetical protein A3770_15p75200 [Chloropicon primus]|eukprot:QDZ25002.1 hypothetical protein A3770_15p75200 [Chloropicon primus]